MTLMGENRWMYVSLFSKKNVENKTVGNMQVTNSKCPNPELEALASPASVDVHPCSSLCDFHTCGW